MGIPLANRAVVALPSQQQRPLGAVATFARSMRPGLRHQQQFYPDLLGKQANGGKRQITLYEILKGHSFLAGVPESQLDRLSRLARLSLLALEVSFEEGDVILSAGQHSKHFYLLLSGSVCVGVCGRAGTICVQALGSGNAFGWSALLDHHDTLFQVRARESSTALRLDAEDLCTAFRQDAELAAEILRRALNLVAGRVQATETKLAEFCGVRGVSIPRESKRDALAR